MNSKALPLVSEILPTYNRRELDERQLFLPRNARFLSSVDVQRRG